MKDWLRAERRARATERQGRALRRLVSGALGGRTEQAQPIPAPPRAQKTRQLPAGGAQLPGIVTGAGGETLEVRLLAGFAELALESDTGDGDAKLFASDSDSFVVVSTATLIAMLECTGTTAYLLVQAGGHYINAIADDTADRAWIAMSECASDVDAADSNTGRIFMRDNGSGKTQFCARFPTGAVKVIVTED